MVADAPDRSTPTLYEVLGVDPTAPDYLIEAAYKAQLRRRHPDRVTDPTARSVAEEHVKQLADIRDLLTDRSRRAAYDATLRPTGTPARGPAFDGAGTASTWAPPLPPTPWSARAAAGAAAVVGPLCTVTFVLALLLTSPAPTAAWALLSFGFGIAVGLAGPALPGGGSGIARFAFAVGLSPITGIVYLPAMSKAALGRRPVLVPAGPTAT